MSSWSLIYENFDPKHEPLRESLTTLGNGYFATRGAASSSQADEIHYPGTYLAGGYNRLSSQVADRVITNEDLVNWPNWLPITFRPEESECWFNLQAVEIIAYKQALEMKSGMLSRTIHFKDHEGRETTVKTRRIVSQADPHIAALEYSITPHNWSGKIVVKSSLDGSVINSGVSRYRELNSKHLKVISLGEKNNRIYLYVKTNKSHIYMAQVAKHSLFVGKEQAEAEEKLISEQEVVSKEYRVKVNENQTLRVEKIISLFTSRDQSICECLVDALLASEHVANFSTLVHKHKLAWKFLWHRFDVELDAKSDEQIIVRLHIFHLLQSISLNSVDRDVGVPARGLHGEAYRGHIFWDELFIFPFYSCRMPEITRSLLMYRYHRLPMARYLAKEAGLNGAMYPWQSGSNGQEETQLLHLNPRSNTWGPDLSRYQRHVNAAIVYNVWQYFRVTNNTHFLTMFGAEMILEIARLFASLTKYSKRTKRYHIKGVVGPDEYHEQYPGSDKPGINDNAYTNVMAVWTLERALKVLEILQPDRKNELLEQLAITEEELTQWQAITHKMYIPFHDKKIISQFEGYDQLKEFDWCGYLNKYGNIERLDRVLKAEGDSCNNYKVSKQADVLMLFYLFSCEELTRIFHQLGYTQFKECSLQDNVEYYMKRTSHGSTLSKVVFASELMCLDEEVAFELFREALASDISDSQGGTTPEGIHLGAMSGTVDIVMRRFAGIQVDHEGVHFSPKVSDKIYGLRFRLQHVGQWIYVNIKQGKLYLTLEKCEKEKVAIYVYGEAVELTAGKTREFAIHG